LSHVPHVCCASHLNQRCRVLHVARSTPGSGVWERATAKCGRQTLLLTPPPPVHTPVCPLLLVLGTVSPCVQRWAARWHPPPALGEHPRWSWRVLTLLWSGGRGACTGRADEGSCAVWRYRVCAGGRIRLPPKDLSGDGARVCPPSTPHQLTRVDVSTHAERPPSLYTGRAAAADTGRASGAVKGLSRTRPVAVRACGWSTARCVHGV
jgi:hypothetical protein